MHFRRTATADTELGGRTIRAGDKVVIWFVSADYDDAVFADPFTFDIHRPPNQHVAFGLMSPHLCLGAQLARMEIKVLFEELLPRLADVRLDGPVDRLRSNFIAGIKRLPVSVVGGGRAAVDRSARRDRTGALRSPPPCEFDTIEVRPSTGRRGAGAGPSGEAEPAVVAHAGRDRGRGPLVRHPRRAEGGRRVRSARPGVLGRRRRVVVRRRRAPVTRTPAARTTPTAAGGWPGRWTSCGPSPSPRCRGWCVGGGLVLAARVRPARRRPLGPLLDPRGRAGHPAGVGRHPPAGARDRSGADQGAGDDVPRVRTRRGQGAGFLNRVVDDDDLDAAVDELVATLVRMPKLALLATKAHTNAVTEAMVSTGRSWSDADGLLAGLRDPEGRESARRYLDRVRSKPS